MQLLEKMHHSEKHSCSCPRNFDSWELGLRQLTLSAVRIGRAFEVDTLE